MKESGGEHREMTEEARMREKSIELGNGDEDKVTPRGWPWERGYGGAGSTGRGAECPYLPGLHWSRSVSCCVSSTAHAPLCP